MGKQHLKLLTAPKTWKIKRKVSKFVTRPRPCAHRMDMAMPLNLIFRDMLCYADTAMEARALLRRNEILIDGRRRTDPKDALGLMDTLSLPKMNEYYRMVLDRYGCLVIKRIDKQESTVKPCRIENKKIIRGGIVQLNLSSGRNIRVEKDSYKVGDTLLITLPGQEIKEHIPLETGCLIYLLGGSHVSEIVRMESAGGNKVKYSLSDGRTGITLKRFVFAIGKDKPVVSVTP